MLDPVASKDRQVFLAYRAQLRSRVYKFCRDHSYPVIQDIKDPVTKLSNLPASAKKIVYINVGDLIEEYAEWIKFNQQCIDNQKIVFVLTDNFYNYQNLSNIKFFSFTEMNGIFAVDDPINVSSTKSKLYNCFINRCESTRQSWFYLLHHYNLLDRGYVSLLLNNLETYSPYQGKELFDYIHHQYGLNQLPHFEKAYQALKDQVPYRNFKEIGDLTPYINDSKYSLVLETCATDPTEDKWHYSEKSLRALQQPNIPLLFVQTKGIALLKSLGFELYVDQLPMDDLPWQARQQELLKFLIEDPVEYQPDRAIEMCRHNRQILKNMLSLAMNENYFDKFFDSINAE
jgi:hypothetical protein